MSVSASAAFTDVYSYSGVGLPEIPDAPSGYSYSLIYRTSSYYYVMYSNKAFYAEAYKLYTPTGSSWVTSYLSDSGWTSFTSGSGEKVISDGFTGFVWCSPTIYDAGGWVWQYTSSPVYQKSISSLSPILAVTANVLDSTSVRFDFSATLLNVGANYEVRADSLISSNPASDIIGSFSGSRYFVDSDTVSNAIPGMLYSFRFTLIQDGVDIYYTDVSFTMPAPTYDPQISVFPFSVTSNTLTCQIDMTDFDPSGSYRLYYDLCLKSDVGDSDAYIARGYSNQIGIISGVSDFTGYHRFTDLSPNTDYYVAWTVEDIATGDAVPVVDSFYFTTLDDGSGGGGSGSSDDNSGILLMILNKVSAILDTISGGQSDGILASISEKLDALVETLANPAEQAVEESFQETTQYVADEVFGEDSELKVTPSTIGDVASVATTGKQLFAVPSTIADFISVLTGDSAFGWFSEETKTGLNTVDSASPALFSVRDTLSKEETAWDKQNREYWTFFGMEE